MISQYDVVRLIAPIPDEPMIPVGSIGAVLEIYSKPSEAYEVEFHKGGGESWPTLAVSPLLIEKVIFVSPVVGES